MKEWNQRLKNQELGVWTSFFTGTIDMIQSTTCARVCESHAQLKGALKIFDTFL